LEIGETFATPPSLGRSGNEGVFCVQFRATDPDGASCTGTVKVSVPKSIKDTAVDSGQTYNSFGP
jgi:hypothetical protein